MRAKKKKNIILFQLFIKKMPLSLIHSHRASLSLSFHLSQSQLSQLQYLSQPHSLNVVLQPLGRGCAPASWIEVASLTSTLPLGCGCAPVCVGIGVEIGVWFRCLGS